MYLSTIAAGVGLANAIFGGNDAGKSNDAAGDAQRQAAEISADQWNYYKTNYKPLETSLINQAQTAGSQDEFARARGAANADVTGAFDKANKQTESRMQAYGINPGSPRYQSTMASSDLAQGATTAGALTAADNNTRNLAYSKALDVVGLGKNIPAQSAASSINAANSANSMANNQFLQNQITQKNIGTGINGLTNAASKWFSGGKRDTSGDNLGYGNNAGNNFGIDENGGYGDGGKYAEGGRVVPNAKTGVMDEIDLSNESQRPVSQPAGSPGQQPLTREERAARNAKAAAGPTDPAMRRQMGLPPLKTFAEGGVVIEANRTGNGRYDASGLDMVMDSRGINPEMRNKVVTPHMRHFADGGGVGRQGLGDDDSDMGMPNDVSATSQPIDGVGTETSDSIPAEIDGQQPAALSKGEFVVNADAVELTGEEILKAINDAGLKKRQQFGLEPEVTSNDVSINAGEQAYAEGGRVGTGPNGKMTSSDIQQMRWIDRPINRGDLSEFNDRELRAMSDKEPASKWKDSRGDAARAELIHRIDEPVRKYARGGRVGYGLEA